jgi:hypothetical protein
LVLAQGARGVTVVPLQLATRSNKSRYGFEGAARLVNCYAEEIGADAKAPVAIYPTEGMDAWITPKTGTVKAIIGIESRLYGVTQDDDNAYVWSVDASDVVTQIATLTVADSWYFARNRRNPTTQIGLVSSTGLYWKIENVTLTQITDADLPPPTSITVRDGYFVLPTTFGRYFITGEDNADTISALDFGTAQRNPDSILRAIASETDIVLFGSDSTEWHANQPSTTASFPFVPVAMMELGLLAANCVAKLNRDIIFAASDGTVRRLNGYGADIISTPPVERAIGSVTASTIRAFAWTVKDTGKSWFALRSSQWCWVFDLDGGTGWHERQTYGSATWRVVEAATWNGVTLLGDAENGTIYKPSGELHKSGSLPIVMTVQAPPVEALPYPLTIHALTVDVVPGQGNPQEPETGDDDPKLMMSYSDDGGRTWSVERQASMGRQGQYLTRCKFTRLGQVRRNGRTFRFSASASVARGLLGASLDVTRDV